jgi:PhnB protein
MSAVKAIPEGYRTVTPYLTVKNASKAIDYYKNVFGAKERLRMNAPDGRVGHAELEIGDSVIMLSDEYPDMGGRSPETLGGTPVAIMLYVPKVDDVFNRAVQAGGKSVRPVENQFYGDRSGTLEDPFGHKWHISTHVEDVAPDELQRRADKAMAATPA